jgi:tRNA (guanine-N7-)-methyltransferase
VSETPNFRRTVRSFVRRTGRMTGSQERALEELWPRYGIDYENSPLDLREIFGRDADRTLEIGFGNGDTLVLAATDNPDQDFIGVEVHKPGVGHCLIQANRADIDNLRVISHDAIEVLQNQIPDAALARINLLFPDPWPKKRHHKRRIIQPSFLTLVADKLQAGGALYIATDWEGYAEHIDEVLELSKDFELAERREHRGDSPLDRHTTKFETRGLRKGHRIWDWRFQKA